MGKDAEIYDKAYIDGSDIWDNVKHKNIHQLMFGDLNERLERLRYLYCINKVLNLGSGDGQNIKFLMRKAASIDNWDISKSGIQKINKAYNGVSGVYAETVDLNLTENYNLAKYDYIEGIAILHHINTKEFIIKLAKEMKETAVAVFLEPGALNPPAIIARRLMRTNYHTDDEHPFLLWKFEKFLNGHFKNVEIYQLTYSQTITINQSKHKFVTRRLYRSQKFHYDFMV